MKTLILISVIILTSSLSAQMGINNSVLSIKGNFTVFGDITGQGAIKISTGLKFKAENVDCSVKMIHDQTTNIKYLQECGCDGLEYDLFDMTGKFLMSGIYSNSEYSKFVVFSSRKDKYLILRFENGLVKKIGIGSI